MAIRGVLTGGCGHGHTWYADWRVWFNTFTYTLVLTDCYIDPPPPLPLPACDIHVSSFPTRGLYWCMTSPVRSLLTAYRTGLR